MHKNTYVFGEGKLSIKGKTDTIEFKEMGVIIYIDDTNDIDKTRRIDVFLDLFDNISLVSEKDEEEKKKLCEEMQKEAELLMLPFLNTLNNKKETVSFKQISDNIKKAIEHLSIPIKENYAIGGIIPSIKSFENTPLGGELNRMNICDQLMQKEIKQRKKADRHSQCSWEYIIKNSGMIDHQKTFDKLSSENPIAVSKIMKSVLSPTKKYLESQNPDDQEVKEIPKKYLVQKEKTMLLMIYIHKSLIKKSDILEIKKPFDSIHKSFNFDGNLQLVTNDIDNVKKIIKWAKKVKSAKWEDDQKLKVRTYLPKI